MAANGTGVSIGARNVRVVQVRKSKEGSWQVTRALVAPFTEQDPSEQKRIAEGRAAVTSAQAKGPALLGVSGRDLIMRYTHVPPVPDWKLEMLMNFEIQEVSEQSGGDVSAAYAPLAVDDTTSGDNVVLVALSKNASLRPRLDALASSGVDLLGGCPRAVGAYECYKELGHLSLDDAVAIVNVGHENTDIAIARKGTLLFARNVAGGGKLLTDAIVQNLRVDVPTAEKLKITKGNLTPRGKAKYRDSMEEKVAHALMQAGGHFVSAVNSSVMFAKAQTKVPDCTLGKVVLCGGGAQLRGFAEYLESNLNVPVEVFDPMQHLDLSALGAEQQNAIKQDQGGMTVAVGLAMLAADERSTRVMLLPEDEKKKRAFREKTVFMIGAAVVVVVGLAVGWSMRSSARAAGKDERTKLEQRKQQYEKQASEYAAAARRVDVVTQQRDALRRQVALGPAVQLVLDTVQGVLNPKGGQGFDEVFIENTAARMNRVSEKDADGNEHSFEAAEVTLSGVVLELGSRPVATTHSDFMSALQRTLKENGGLVLANDSGLQQQTRAFRIVIRQMRTPEQVAAERAAAADKKE